MSAELVPALLMVPLEPEDFLWPERPVWLLWAGSAPVAGGAVALNHGFQWMTRQLGLEAAARFGGMMEGC